jgi:hypothetical protein
MGNSFSDLEDLLIPFLDNLRIANEFRQLPPPQSPAAHGLAIRFLAQREVDLLDVSYYFVIVTLTFFWS